MTCSVVYNREPKGIRIRATCVSHNNSKEHSGALIVVYKELRKTNCAILTTDIYHKTKSLHQVKSQFLNSVSSGRV